MSYQTALSGLDWSMVPSGMSVPAAGIVAMTTYESGMGAILASNNVGSLNINISSSNYTGTIGDITNEIIAISGTTSSNRTVTLYFNASTQNGVKSYKVYIPSASLVAGSGGPYTLTITTGSGNSVWVPISATGNTLYSTSGVSNNLMFNIYVDSSGNVTSDDWQISGSNSYGSFVQFADGTMEEYKLGTITAYPTLITFPIPFIDTTYKINGNGEIANSANMASFNPASRLVGSIYAWVDDANGSNHTSGLINWRASGRWR